LLTNEPKVEPLEISSDDLTPEEREELAKLKKRRAERKRREKLAADKEKARQTLFGTEAATSVVRDMVASGVSEAIAPLLARFDAQAKDLAELRTRVASCEYVYPHYTLVFA
jgi:predicted Holliday junction resolvase-like endonuclease